MATTTLPTVKAQLVSLLKDRVGLAAVQVTYVWPGDAIEQVAVWLGDARGGNEYPVIRAGRKPRDETYTVDVFMQALSPEAWDETSEVRVLQLLAELEDTVADDPALGLSATLPTLTARVASWTLTNGLLGDSGWGSLIRAEVEVTSRLS